jgi:hypothetical protein
MVVMACRVRYIYKACLFRLVIWTCWKMDGWMDGWGSYVCVRRAVGRGGGGFC